MMPLGRRWIEIGLALFTASVGVVVMWGAREGGVGWSDAGPEAGYFPFHIGLLLALASLANVLTAAVRRGLADETFVSREGFRRVLAVFLPIALYVACIPFAGIYLASAGFIAWFMWRDRRPEGAYGLPLILAVSIGSAVTSYLIFDLWFKVPLPAGPLSFLEQWPR